MGGETSKKLRENVDRLADNDRRCIELNCEGLKIGDRGIAALSDALQTNTRLKSLRLGDCAITHIGARTLSNAICQSHDVSRLRRLDFTTSDVSRRGNPLGNEGAIALSEILLDQHTRLQTFVLRNCNIGDEGAIAMADALKHNQTLMTLELSDNLISDKGAEMIGKALIENCTLKGLSLWHNRLFPDGAEGLAAGLRQNSTLDWLGLGCNHIGDIGLKAISEALQVNSANSSLRWLALGGNNITDRGIKHLALLLKGSLQPENDNEVETRLDADTLNGTRCRLESIGLGGNDVSDVGAKQLADALQYNKVLKSLGLADNRIGDEGAIDLANAVHESESLETLVVSGNDIGDEGASQLAAALAKNQSLKSLFVAENDFSNDSGRRFVEVLSKHNVTLKVLDIHNSAMSPDGMKEVVDALQTSHLTTVGGELSQVKVKTSPVRMSMSGNALPLDARERLSSGTTIFRSSAPGWDQSHRTMDSLPGEGHDMRSAAELDVASFQGARQQSDSQLDSDGDVLDARQRAVQKAAGKFLKLRLVGQDDTLFEQKTEHVQSAQDETSFITSDHNVPRLPSNSHMFQSHVNHQQDSVNGQHRDVNAQLYSHSNTESVDSSEDNNPAMSVNSMERQLEHITDRHSDCVSDVGHIDGHDDKRHSFVNTQTVNIGSDGNMQSDPVTVIGPTGATGGQGGYDEETHDKVNGLLSSDSISSDARDSVVETFDNLSRSASESSLSHLTKDRPRQLGKRKPSRSPSGSSISNKGMDKESLQPVQELQNEMVIYGNNHVGISQEEKIEGDLHATRMGNLRQRVNVMQLGGSLQNLFDQIVIRDVSYNHDFTTARLPENAYKNCRDSHTPLPPESTRVELTFTEGMEGSDYINASFVGLLNEPKKFIVAQSPLEDTFPDFWRMIWEQSVRLIVMLGKTTEGGEAKCEKYWPDWQGYGDDYGLVCVSGPGKPGRWAPGALHVTSSRDHDESIVGLKSRDFTLEHTLTEEMRTVTMYQYRYWPDGSIPASIEAIIELARLLVNKKEEINPEWPVLVHGHVGSGRCGSFCAIMLATEILSRQSTSLSNTITHTGHIVDDIVSTIRSQRPQLVRNARQFEFIHQAVYQAITSTAQAVDKAGSSSKQEDTKRDKKEKKKSSWFGRGNKGQVNSKDSKASSSSSSKSKFSLFHRKSQSATQQNTSALMSDAPAFDDALY